MKNILLLIFFVMLVALSVLLEKPDKIEVYEFDERLMVNEESLITYTDPRIIHDFVESFKEAEEITDGVDLVPPNFLVRIKDDFYSLWINESGGMIMNYNDTHTYFSLSKNGARKIYNQLVLLE